MKKVLFTLSLIGCILLVSCRPKGNQSTTADDNTIDTCKIVVKYAKGFKITYKENCKLLEIQDPQKDSSKIYRYALVPRGQKPKDLPADYAIIETPIHRVICMTSLQLSNFIKLNALNEVVGITSTRHLFNKEMKERIKSGKTIKIGMEGNFNDELILSANPELIFISPLKRGGYDNMRETNIPLVPHLGYKEMSPLGQAEWIKFIALFINKEQEANQMFSQIEKNYIEAKKLAANVKRRPIVFSGEIRGGNWYTVGGKSFLAQLFRDAGADFFLKDDQHSGGMNLDFETVYAQADKCDFWRIVNSYEGQFSYDALKKTDPRYADFRAFKEKGVVYCNMKQRPFYESMPVEPDVVLKDFIKAFHPELLPSYKAVYYERLK